MSFESIKWGLVAVAIWFGISQFITVAVGAPVF